MPVNADDAWRVRIRGAGGVCGAGVLVAPDLVLTCAHVVALALRTARSGPRPPDAVIVEFPIAESAGSFTAYVLADGWIPVAANNTGDLALLRLTTATDFTPARLAPCGPPAPRPVRVFGHPGGDRLGRWANAQLSGTAGPTGEWMQLNDLHSSGPQIAQGYSGAGVVDRTGAVIGLLVAIDRQAAAKGAWMLTVEATAARLPALHPLVDTAQPAPARPAASVQRPPSATRASYEHALVEALTALDGIEDRSHRDDLVIALERGLDRPLSARRSDRFRTDLVNLVAACNDFAAGNAFSQLVDAARALHGDTPAVRRLAELAAQNPARQLTTEELAELETLVGEFPPAEVVEASRLAFGPLGPRIGLDSRNLTEVIGALTELMGGATESPPLLVFLQLLARGNHGPRAERVRDWIDHIARRWQVPVTELDTEELATGPPPARSYLVVELREDGPSPDQYLLSIWLEHDNGDGCALLVNDDQTLTIDEIPGHIGSHLRRVAGRQIGPIGTLTIEFVLPHELLGHPVDQFNVSLDSGPQLLGAAFPVVVRSLDRIMNQLTRHRWQARWNWFKRHQDAADTRAISWITIGGTGRHALEESLSRNPSGYSEEYPACLVLTGRPRGGRTTLDSVRDGLEIGMPVMLWCRAPRQSEQFWMDTINQLNGRPLAELPTVVQRLRNEAVLAGRPPDHLGLSVTLLWDDADRMTLSPALKAPA